VKFRLAGFSSILLLTMAVSTLAFFTIAVAASELQAEFEISKFEIGLLGAVNTLVGGLFSPIAGRLSDRLGGRNAMAGTLLISGSSAIAIGLSTSYGMLLATMAFAGLAQGWGNPSCNKAIATGIEDDLRGIITGIKQSGVQTAVFAAGFLVPWLTREYGWRYNMWVVAGVSFASLFGIVWIRELPDGHQDFVPSTGEKNDGRLPTFVTQVAIFGFLLGIVGGGLGRFIPLFAEEEVGFSFEQAGRVFGIQGLIAIPCRLLSGIALDRGVSARRMLTVMGAGGALSIVFLLLASGGSPNYLWIGTVLGGMTLGSWNTAGQLSMVRQKQNAGKATGRLMLGFLIGLTVGGPAVGWSIDSFGYSPAWIASAILALAGAAVVARSAPDDDRYA
jgi:sugar phosphate permease